MMRNRKIAANVLIASALLTGCGKAAAATAPAATTASSTTPAATETSSLVIYSPHDAEPMNAALNAFLAAYPDIKVELVPAGTGELCDRIKAEADSPQADVFWGGGADSMEAYADYFEVYFPAEAEQIPAEFRSVSGKWTGESPLPMVLIYNRKVLQEYGLREPTSWADLADPAYRGMIAYCQPAKSGSAYTQLCTMIQAMGGGETGWNYVQRFVENLDGKILDSSGNCHKLVASGEYAVGVTIEKSAMTYAGDENIGFCYPSEGTSAVPDAIAIIKDCPDPENARIFVDYIMSYTCQAEQSADWSRRPSRTDVPEPAGVSDLSQIKLISYDLAWSAASKQENIRRFNELAGLDG